MAKQLIPRLTPQMLTYNPDQVTQILNRAIDEINAYSAKIDEALALAQAAYKKANEPVAPAEWGQIKGFDPTHMGTTVGMCLQNCREGFGIMWGHFNSAREDMQSQAANGTLHDEEPPAYLQVPVYVESGTPAGHVVVWDRGVVWSDGNIVQDGLAHWSTVYGWGELCDGTRVVIQKEQN